MKTKSIIIGLLIVISSLFALGNSNTAKAETTTGTEQQSVLPRVELVWVNGILWIILYDADDNIIQASAVGHSE